MRIAHLTGTFSAFSGIDRVVALLATEQLRAGHQVTILTLDGDMDPPPGAKLIKLGLPKSSLWQRIYRLWMGLDRAGIQRGVAALAGVETIYSHQYPMNLIAQAARRQHGSRYVYYDHGLPPNEVFSSIIERVYISLFRRLANQSIRNCDEAISISQYLQAELQRQTGVHSRVVPDQVDTQRYHPGVSGQAVREQHRLGNHPVVLYVGRISPHKGLHLLLEAWRIVESRRSGARLLIVGKPTFPAYFKNLKSQATPSVIFAGYVPDQELPNYYGAANVYATATLWEGFNLPIAEAQACGKPAVAFNLGPHAEVIKPPSVLVSPKDTMAMAEAILSFLT